MIFITFQVKTSQFLQTSYALRDHWFSEGFYLVKRKLRQITQKITSLYFLLDLLVGFDFIVRKMASVKRAKTSSGLKQRRII